MIKNRLQLLLLGTAILIALAVLLFLFSARFSTSPQEGQITPFPTPTQFPQSPQGKNKTTISGIEVNDFFKTSKEITKQGDALITQEKTYNIAYLPQFNLFQIVILASPFEDIRKQAEEEFLKTLGITKEDACKLDVSITSPVFANPEISGKTYYLSFCEGQ